MMNSYIKSFAAIISLALVLLTTTSCRLHVVGTARRPYYRDQWAEVSSQRLWNRCYPYVARVECDSWYTSSAYVNSCMYGIQSEFWSLPWLDQRQNLLIRYGCPPPVAWTE